MPRKYISKVKIPGDTAIYYIKDDEARDSIEDLVVSIEDLGDLIKQLGDFTSYLGITTTELTDGSTTNPITIDGESVTAVAGNIVSYNDGSGSLYTAKDFIFNGTKWQEFANPTKLGKFAYVDTGYVGLSVTKSGTVTKQTKALSKTAIPVTVTNTSTDGSKVVTDISTKSITYAYSVSKATFSGTSASIDFSGTATQTGATVSITNTKTAATLTKNTATTLAIQSATSGFTVVTGGTSSQVLSNTTTITNGTSATATTFNPLSSITITTSGTDLQIASVTDEILQIYALKPTTMSVYGLAASNTKYMTGPESLSKVAISAYTGLTTASINASVPKDIWVTGVSFSKATAATVNIDASVSGTIDYTPDGTVTVVLSTSTANAVSTVTSGYAKVSAYAGGDTVVSGITDGITVALASSSTNTFTVYPSISNP